MIIENVVLGFVVATLVGHFIIWLIIDKHLRKGPTNLTSFINIGLLGCAERALYVIALLMEMPQWIAVWLSIKVAVTWKSRKTDSNSSNIFLVGNALSVLFGFIGAWIAWGFSLPK